MNLKNVHLLITHPLGPTRPYLRWLVMFKSALMNKSFPLADMLNFSTYKKTNKQNRMIKFHRNYMHYTILLQKREKYCR